MAFRMALVVLPEGKDKWKNAQGRTECVELIRQTTGAPATRLWRPGLRIRDAKAGQIPPYTAIATFVDDHYPTDDRGKHAAIYLGHNGRGIQVIDQWNKQGEARERTITFDNPHTTSRSNEGNWYYVIEVG
jgi:hypothetical protein